MNKIILWIVFLMCFPITVMAMTFQAESEEGVIISFYYYRGDLYVGTEDEKNAIDVNTVGSLTIPDNVDGWKVKGIGNSAFKDCTCLTFIKIPDCVTEIKRRAFYGCTGLTSICIPDGVTTIGDAAFSGCISINSITIPESVTTIGTGVFSSCYGLTSINFPNNISEIPESTFNQCRSLDGVAISNILLLLSAKHKHPMPNLFIISGWAFY